VRPAMLFDNFQIISIYIIDVIIYSLLFKSVRIVSEQYLNERTVQTARNDLPITHFSSAKSIYHFLILLNHSENTGRPIL